MKNITLIGLMILFVACGVVAQAGVVFTDDFSTDPFASRWTNASIGGGLANWNSAGENVELRYSSIETTTANDFVLNTQLGASWAFDFQLNEQPGPWIRTNAFRNPGVDAGYGITCYYSNGWAPWFPDARLTRIDAGGDHTPLVTSMWYTFKTDILDTGTASIVTVQVSEKVSGISAGYAQFSDSSATRLTVQNGLYISGYQGDTGAAGPFVDNVTASSVPEPGSLVALASAMAAFAGIVVRKRG
jgi:hypothetical protein